MMDLDKTEEVLDRHFPGQNFSKIEGSKVFKCIKKYRDTPYEVLFIDCEDAWTRKEFDLEEYQEKYLLNDFYKTNDYLQWNFYFIFLGDQEKIEENRLRKEMIERDQIYSRKFVMSPKVFDEWLYQTKEISASNKSGVKQDLSSKWINFLNNSDLDCVYLKDVNYTDGVKRYLEGEPIKEETANDDSNGSSAERIHNIDEFTLSSYRKFPLKREYNFGKVNLIKGVNGSGKTSLLEAIEIWLCGESYRNPNEDKSDYRIEGYIDDKEKPIEFSPDDISVYKKRDAYWYNNPYHRGSIKTHLNFKKYNFFNSDAAFELSSDPNSYNIKEAFQDMALGETVNFIEKRLDGYLERFEREFRRYTEDIKEWNKEINKEEKVLEELSDLDKDPGRLFEEFKKECQNSGWLIDETLGREKLLTNFQKDHSNAEQLLESINEKVFWIEEISKENIGKIAVDYSKSVRRVNEINKDLKQIEIDIEELEERQSEILLIQKNLKKLSEYYSFDNTDELVGIDEKIQKYSKTVDKCTRIEELLNNTSLKFLENRTGYLNDYEEELLQKIKKINKERSEVSERIKSVRKGINLLEEIISDIKSKGRQFINNNPDANECPLCHTKFEGDQLNENINKAHTEFSQSGLLEELTEKENNLIDHISTLEERKNNLSQIKELSFYMYGDNYSEIKIHELIQSLNENSEKLKQARENLEQAELFKQKFLNEGLSEEEYQELLEFFENKELNIANDEIDEQLAEAQERIGSLKGTKSNKIENRVELESEKETILNNKVFGADNKEKALRKRNKDLKSSLKRLEDLRELIEFDEGLNIDELENRISGLYSLYQRTKELFNEKKQNEIRLKAANEKVEELGRKISNTKEVKERAEKATESIKYIFNNYSKSGYLTNFFQDNKKEITDTFMMIHAPREFSSLDFKEENGSSVRLTRSRSGEEVTLNEISSGQRSALALSIFLTLNKQLHNGPDIMLFDDPVTTIDDLNVLSFLDYLRELVISSNRQVFFATANDDLANLFKKKFSFLDEHSFKKFELSRS